MKQGYAKCMAVQWRQIWAKIAATSSKFIREIKYDFESQEVRNPMLQMDSNLELKQGRYGQLNQCCARSMLLRDCIHAQFYFVVWADFWASSWVNFCWQLGHLGFLFSLTLFFVIGLLLVILDFIQILISKYATGSLKAMGKVSI